MKQLSLFLFAALLLSLLAGCSAVGVLPEGPVGPAVPTDGPTETAPIPFTEPTETEPPSTAAPIADDGGVHPMLFRVTGPGGREMYLFGTIHVGDDRTAEALDTVTPYLDRCDALAVEFDIVAYEKDLSAATQDLMRFVLTDGTTIEDHLDPDLYARASALVGQAGLYPSMWKQFDLSMWSQLVDSAALLVSCPELSTEAGMDRHLIGYCSANGIEVRDVESAALQYGLLASFSDELNRLLIRETLDNLDTYSEGTHSLYEAWLSGDYGRILSLVESEDEAGDYTPEELAMVEDYNYRMLDERNLGMRDKALQWLEAGDKVFFAVGAAHLVGDAGLVTLLRQSGCTVEQILGASAH